MTGLVRPKDVVTAFLEAWNRHDSKALGGLFAEHAEFVSVVGAWWKSRAEIEASYRRMYGTIFRGSHLRGEIVSLKRLRPDIATVHLTWELTGETEPDGSPVAARKGVLLMVLSDDNGWHIQVAQATGTMPGVPAPTTRA
jgi:uncharacterized protein (TIGR02246 family)